MPMLDRDSFIALLNDLGHGDDARALAAARAIAGRMAEVGLAWEDLLVPADGAARPANDGAALAAVPAGDDLALLDRILARRNLSPELRIDLQDLRADIEAGDGTPADSKYLRDLEQRLINARAD